MGVIKSSRCLRKAGPKREGRDNAEEPRERGGEGVSVLAGSPLRAAGLLVLLLGESQALQRPWEYRSWSDMTNV